MEIRKLTINDSKDFRSLVEIFKEVFENEEEAATDEQFKKLLSNPDFIVFVVSKDQQVVGGLTSYVLHRYYNSKPIAYIYDVGITPKMQNQGLGKALIAEACSDFKSNGFEDAYVEAESDDLDAVNFYRKTKFTSELNAIHFTYELSNEKGTSTNR